MAGLKVSEKGFQGNLASLVLLAATLGLAVVLIFMALDAIQHRYSVLQAELAALALVGALAGGALSRNWTDAWRAVLNGFVIATGYMGVYGIDALLEERAARTLFTCSWTLGSIAGLVLALQALSRLPLPPVDPKDLL